MLSKAPRFLRFQTHIGFSPDPGRRRDSLYPPYFLNQLVEFYHTCMDTSLGQGRGLIKFW